MSEDSAAVCRAKSKLERIITAEGDMDGQRREPWYLAAMIEEEARMDVAAVCFDGRALQYAV